MNFKTLLFSFTLIAGVEANAALKNLCDDMVASGKSTDEQIQKCIAKLGESDTYKENIQKKKWQQAADEQKIATEVAKKANIEMKKFTKAELDEASFDKGFIAMTLNYSKNPNQPDEDRITKGDVLCKHLGFEKVVQSSLLPVISSKKASGNGLVIKTLLTFAKDPELYKEDNPEIGVRKYYDITCARVISKEFTGSAEELAKVIEEIKDYDNRDIKTSAPKVGDKKNNVNDGPRKPAADGKSDFGVKVPDWHTDAPAEEAIDR